MARPILCTSQLGTNWIDDGTLALTCHQPPGPTGTKGASGPGSTVGGKQVTIPADKVERLRIVIEKAIPYLPTEARDRFAEALTPQALAALVGLLAVWGASHLIGIGQAVDVLLIGVGVATFGHEAIAIADKFRNCTTLVLAATSDSDLEHAAQGFAETISKVGVDVLIVILTHRVATTAKIGVQGVAINTRLAAASEKVALVIQDSQKLLPRFVAGARTPAEKAAVIRWLQTIEQQAPNFQGRPNLRVTTIEERWIRASDSGTRAEGALVEQLSGRALTAYEDGAYLAQSPDRSSSAVLRSWNRMNVVEEQLLPAGSIVLEGTAASQAPTGTWASEGYRLPGGGRQIFHAGQVGADGSIVINAAGEVPIAQRAVQDACTTHAGRRLPTQ